MARFKPKKNFSIVQLEVALLLFAVLPAVSFAAPVQQAVQNVQVATQADVDRLLQKNQLQEAAWLLSKMGRQQEADQVTAQLSKILSTGSFVVEPFAPYKGIAGKAFLDYGNGIRGIFKPDAKMGILDHADSPLRTQLIAFAKNNAADGRASSYSEIAAFDLDNKVFRANVVPNTQRLSVEGVRGSVQYMVHNIVSHDNPSTKASELAREQNSREFEPVLLFDYLSENVDRHGENWLNIILSQNVNKIVAIDQGDAFRCLSTTPVTFDSRKGVITSEQNGSHTIKDLDRDFMQNILAAKDSEIQQVLLNDHVDPNEIKRVISRVHELQAYINAPVPQGKKHSFADFFSRRKHK